MRLCSLSAIKDAKPNPPPLPFYSGVFTLAFAALTTQKRKISKFGSSYSFSHSHSYSHYDKNFFKQPLSRPSSNDDNTRLHCIDATLNCSCLQNASMIKSISVMLLYHRDFESANGNDLK